MHLVKKVAEHNGSPIQIRDYLVPSASNNVAALLFGHRLDYDDPKRRWLDEALQEMMALTVRSTTFIDGRPTWMKKIAYLFPSPWPRVRAVERALLQLSQYTKYV